MASAAIPKSLHAALFIDHVTPQTRLLQKRRQMFEVEEALDAEKEAAARLEESFTRRAEAAKVKNGELEVTIERFNTILHENEVKKERSEKRALEEAKQAGEKVQEIADAKVLLETLRSEVVTLEAEKEKKARYNDFFKRFHGTYVEEFGPDPSDVLSRYVTLGTANNDLVEEQQSYMEELENTKRLLQRIQQAAANQRLRNESLVTGMKERLDAARSRTHELQAGMDDSAGARTARMAEMGTVLRSVFNLHQRCVTAEVGSVIRHSTADGLVLGHKTLSGRVLSAFEDEERHGGSSHAMAGEVASPGAQGSPSRGRGRDASPSGGDGRSASRSPSPSNAADAAESAAALAALAAPRFGDPYKLSPTRLREEAERAVGLLQVVGNYILDLDSIVKDYGPWAREQRIRREQRDAELRAEADKLEAARLARTASRAGRSVFGSSSSTPQHTYSARRKGPQVGVRIQALKAAAAAAAAKAAEEAETAAIASGPPPAGSAAAAATTGLGATTSAAAVADAMALQQQQQGTIHAKGGGHVYVYRGAKLDPGTLRQLTSGKFTPAPELGVAGKGPALSLGGGSSRALSSTAHF